MRIATTLRFLLTVCAAALLGAGAAHAQSALTTPDQQFLNAAAAFSATQIRAGQLAADHAANPDVLDLGLNMVKDHSAIVQDLRDFARGRQITLPTEPSGTQQSVVDRMGKLSGASFDAAYARDMGVAPLKDMIGLYMKAAGTSKDADVKRFAGYWIDTLNDEWRAARNLRVAVPKK